MILIRQGDVLFTPQIVVVEENGQITAKVVMMSTCWNDWFEELS